MMMISLRHILVKHQYEAEDLLRQLQKGVDFEVLARRHSTCSSSSVGGDLGSVRRGKMDEDFENAAFSLKPGETSLKPVRTRFGYHLIQRLK